MIKHFMLLMLGFLILLNVGQAQQPQKDTEEELDLARINERIARTSAEGFEVIEKIKFLRPIIQKYHSAKPLGEIVADFASGRGQFMIYPVGWEALKSDDRRWSISLYFKDAEQKYVKATWGYNKDKNVLYPLEINQATKFWVKGKSIYP